MIAIGIIVVLVLVVGGIFLLASADKPRKIKEKDINKTAPRR